MDKGHIGHMTFGFVVTKPLFRQIFKLAHAPRTSSFAKHARSHLSSSCAASADPLMMCMQMMSGQRCTLWRTAITRPGRW